MRRKLRRIAAKRTSSCIGEHLVSDRRVEPLVYLRLSEGPWPSGRRGEIRLGTAGPAQLVQAATADRSAAPTGSRANPRWLSSCQKPSAV